MLEVAIFSYRRRRDLTCVCDEAAAEHVQLTTALAASGNQNGENGGEWSRIGCTSFHRQRVWAGLGLLGENRASLQSVERNRASQKFLFIYFGGRMTYAASRFVDETADRRSSACFRMTRENPDYFEAVIVMREPQQNCTPCRCISVRLR